MNHYKEFFRYVLPSMLAFALSGVYAIADGFFVGNALGDDALAAINIAYPLTAFLQATGTGIGMGGAIQYAISTGRKEQEKARQYFGMSLILLAFFGVFLTAVTLLAAPAILPAFGASGSVLSLGVEYMRYVALCAVFQIAGTGFVPFIRNMGGAVSAMISMAAGFVTNICLDYLFVWVLPYGMMGAAVATVLGQGVTFLVCLLFLATRKMSPSFHFSGKQLILAKRILQVGLSPFGLTFSPNITLILINKSASVLGGSPAVTAYATVSYISCVVMLLLQGVSDGCQPLLSLYYGKGDGERTKAVCRLAYAFSLATGLFCMAFLFIFRYQAAGLFGSSQQITEEVARILPIFIVGFLFICISRVTTAYFYATEKNLSAYLVIYGEPLSLAVFLLFLPKLFEEVVMGTWVSVPASQFFAAAVCVLLLFYPKKRLSPVS